MTKNKNFELLFQRIICTKNYGSLSKDFENGTTLFIWHFNKVKA